MGEVIYNGCSLSRRDRCQSAKSNTMRLKIKSHLHTFTGVFSRLEMSCQFVKQKELAKTSINPSCWLQVVFLAFSRDELLENTNTSKQLWPSSRFLASDLSGAELPKADVVFSKELSAWMSGKWIGFIQVGRGDTLGSFKSGLVWNCGPLSTLPCGRNTYSFWKHQFNGLV